MRPPDTREAPAEESKLAARLKRQRVGGWLVMGLFLSLVPLVPNAFSDYQPGHFLEAIGTAELLAVAFTLGGAAAADVLAEGSKGEMKWFLGLLTLLGTALSLAVYIVFSHHLDHLLSD